MALVVNSNIFSLNAQRNLSKSQNDLATSMQRLSSGLRINSAKDDAAGLYSVEKMTADIRGLNQAARNAADGISLGQTAEGALGQIGNNLQRIRELAVQSANGTVEDRSGITAEVTQLQEEIKRIIDTTEFNGSKLLDATAADITFQVGQDNDTNHQITVSGNDMTGISAYAAIDVSDQTKAQGVLTTIEADIQTVAQARGTFGAVQNRFEAVINGINNYAENLTASRSRIQDADFAQETAKMTSAQILQQAGVSILSQANVQPQMALSLLG